MTYPRSSSERSRTGSGGCCSTTRSRSTAAAAIDLDYVRRAVRPARRDRRVADRALRAGAALHRLHVGRPHPPPRVAGLGGAAAATAPSPRSTGSSTARSATCWSGRGSAERTAAATCCRLRPRRRLALGRRQPERVARAARAGSPTAAQGRGDARSSATSCSSCGGGSRATALLGQAADAVAARAGLQAARLLDRRLGHDAGLLVRHLRQHRASTSWDASATGSSSRARSTSGCGTEIAEQALELRSRPASRSYRGRAPSRGSVRRGPSWRRSPT